jgi:hypothetical protein
MRIYPNNLLVLVARRLQALLLAACAALSAAPALAYDDRVALVIGNDNYPGEQLKNAVNDARAVQKTLQDLGFKVVFRPNADITAMRGAAVDFAKMLDGATAAVFYYAGHGIQYRDKNYLIPIDAKLTSEPEIVYHALEVGQILDSMEDAKVRYKFVILDACRNNPFRNVFTSSGLAKISRVPPGTIISYAAAAGAVAQDGDGENGLFTKHLLREIRNPNNQAALVFQNIGSAVGQESGSKQIPEFYSVALPGGRPFFFAEGGGRPAVAASGAVSVETNTQVDLQFWNGVKDSKKIDDFQLYLEQFPSGVFARLARSKIDSLKQDKSQQQVAAASLTTVPANNSPVLVAEKPAGSLLQTASQAASQAASQTSSPASSQASSQAQQPAPPVLTAATPPPPRESTTAAATGNGMPIQSAAVQSRQESAPVKLAAAPGTSEVRGIEGKPAAPVATASAPASTPASAPVAAPVNVSGAQTAQSSNAAGAPGANVVAAISPEQKTALPPVPTYPKYLSGTLEFSEGARYVGEYKEDKDKNQILHGKGEYIAKGFRYVGEFRDGKKQGKGIYTWANGDKYEGDFADEQPSGKGKWEFKSGDIYEGEVVKGVMSGKGVIVSKNGDKFDGLFRDNAPNGKGTYRFASGDKFEGVMSAGKMSGAGVYTTKSGDRIEATFVDGTPQGAGTYYFTNGDRYEGDIQGGALTGKGKYFFSNGQRTEGSYRNGVLKGKGAFYFGDGSWFEGDFEDGIKRAKGDYFLKDGTKRAAEMIDGVVKPVGG